MESSLITTLRGKLGKNINYQAVCGLRPYPKEEILEIKEWLHSNSIPFEHRTHVRPDIPLPHNGVLVVNPKRNK